MVTRRVQSPAQISIVFATKSNKVFKVPMRPELEDLLNELRKAWRVFNFTSLHPFEQISQNVIWYLPKEMEEIFKFRSSI